LAKIAENCHHNIDTKFSPIGRLFALGSFFGNYISGLHTSFRYQGHAFILTKIVLCYIFGAFHLVTRVAILGGISPNG
jgi:hypothetical protein